MKSVNFIQTHKMPDKIYRGSRPEVFGEDAKVRGAVLRKLIDKITTTANNGYT
jgi:hypothetical protein